MDLARLTIDKIQDDFAKAKYSSEELTKEYLGAIKADKTNAFISINDEAIAAAQAADKIIGTAKATRLTGIPLAVKDIILFEGMRSTAGSKILENYIASYTATALGRLENAGMVILGKTNCDEFAMGSSNENSYFGPVLNPHDHSRVSGGSSGGSAAAVAAGLAPVALGTDTGGSIRQPASFCGVYGIKPSYGRVSRFGSMAMASSFDQIGVLANNSADLASVLQVMAGHDKLDATSATKPVQDYRTALDGDAQKLRIGVPQEYFSDGLDKEVAKAVKDQIAKLQADGFTIEEVNLLYTDYALAAYYLLMPAEVSSNLARYDGLLYGMTAGPDDSLDTWYNKVRGRGFSAETKRRIMLGTYILSAGYYDAYYKQAQKVRTLIKQDFTKVFADVDILLTPVTPTVAFKVGEKSQDPLAMYMMDVFTVSANIAGICGLSMPIARDSDGLPIGLQLLAGAMAEDKLFTMSNYIAKQK